MSASSRKFDYGYDLPASEVSPSQYDSPAVTPSLQTNTGQRRTVLTRGSQLDDQQPI